MKILRKNGNKDVAILSINADGKCRQHYGKDLFRVLERPGYNTSKHGFVFNRTNQSRIARSFMYKKRISYSNEVNISIYTVRGFAEVLPNKLQIKSLNVRKFILYSFHNPITYEVLRQV